MTWEGTAPIHQGRYVDARRAALAAAAICLSLVAAALFGQGLYIKGKAVVAQVLLERAWAATVSGGEPVKPWSWADTWPVAKVEVGRLQQSAIVLHSASGQAMAFGPGHMLGTPDPGAPGLSVIAAHRDTHFRFLEHVVIGDTVRVTTGDGRTHLFRVSETRIVDAAASGLDPHGTVPRLALVTCYPFGALTEGPLRYVVLAEHVSAL